MNTANCDVSSNKLVQFRFISSFYFIKHNSKSKTVYFCLYFRWNTTQKLFKFNQSVFSLIRINTYSEIQSHHQRYCRTMFVYRFHRRIDFQITSIPIRIILTFIFCIRRSKFLFNSLIIFFKANTILFKIHWNFKQRVSVRDTLIVSIHFKITSTIKAVSEVEFRSKFRAKIKI